MQLQTPDWWGTPPSIEDPLQESEMRRFRREFRKGSELVTAIGLAGAFAVAAAVVSLWLLLVAVPVLVVLHTVRAWRRTLLAQRNEAREEVSRLIIEQRELSEAERAQRQFSSALRAGHFLEGIEAPSSDRDWIDRTKTLLRESIGELEASRVSRRETVTERLSQLQELASEISRGTRSVAPSEDWDRYVSLMVATADGLALSERSGERLRADFFDPNTTLAPKDAERWVKAWLGDVSDFLRFAPAARGLAPDTPFYSSTYDGLSDELASALNRLDRQLGALTGIVPTLARYAKELRGEQA